jgi:hypothetical protein
MPRRDSISRPIAPISSVTWRYHYVDHAARVSGANSFQAVNLVTGELRNLGWPFLLYKYLNVPVSKSVDGIEIKELEG